MKMKKHGIALLIALLMLLTAVMPLSAALADQTGTVVGGWLILRGGPSFNAAILASYPSGTVVTITGQTGSWYSVRTPDGRTGYMNSAYLKISGGGGGGGIPSGSTAYVRSSNGLNVRLRSGPGKGYSIIAAYAPGTACTVLTAGQNWSRIQIGSTVGYMMTQYLTTSPSPQPQPQPQPQPGGEYKVYVTSSNGKGVNLRSGPSKSYPSIGFYSVATEAWMVTAGHTWSYIRIGNRYGYMMSQFLTTTEPPVNPNPPIVGTAYVVSANGRNVNLRAAPTTAGKVIKSFKVGTRLNIITRGSDWYFIQIGGIYGYMMKQFIYDGGSPVPTDPPAPPTNNPPAPPSNNPPAPPSDNPPAPPADNPPAPPGNNPATSTDL